MKTMSIKEFQHEKDGRLLNAVLENQAVDALMDFMRKNRLEEIYMYAYRASCIQLTGENAPEFHGALSTACQMLGLEQLPPVFLTRDYFETISIGGMSQPFLLLSSRYLSRLDEEALLGALASRVAGIQAGHQRALFFDWVLTVAGAYIPGAVKFGIDAAINDWKRCRFFTYDRAFYLATGDRELTLRQLFYPALPDDAARRFRLGEAASEFEVQKDRFFQGDEEIPALKAYHSMTTDKPWLPERYTEILQYMDGGCQ